MGLAHVQRTTLNGWLVVGLLLGWRDRRGFVLLHPD
jgi:hypothetical protein